MEEPDTGQNQKPAQQRVKTGSARLKEIRDQLQNSNSRTGKMKPTPSTSTTSEGTTSIPEVEVLNNQNQQFEEELVLGNSQNWTRINTDPPQFSTVRNLKLALGAIGGIAILLGCICSLLYISRQKRRQRARLQKRPIPSPSHFPPGSFPHNPNHPHPNTLTQSYPPHYFSQPQFNPQAHGGQAPGAWQNGAYGNMMQQAQFDMAQQYPEAYLEHYRQQGLYDPYYAGEYYQQFYQQQHQQQAYPESQADMSEIAFDPVLNYVETIGEGLKTPKRRPKQRKDGSSTPHPIITRRASFKSVRSEVSAWTEDEGDLGRDSPCKIERRGSEELEGERTPKGDSAYGSRGSIQSPNSIHELTGPSDDEKVPDAHVVRFSTKITSAEANDLKMTPEQREMAVE